MTAEKIELITIGTIFTPFEKPQGTPIQPTAAKGAKGRVVVLPEYEAGLKDLESFSHIILIYFFHKISKTALTVTPFLDKKEHGVFATRAPNHPNRVGISVVQLISIEGDTIKVAGVDMLDGTPLLDIKPFVPDFQPSGKISTGWLENREKRIDQARDDGRFL